MIYVLIAYYYTYSIHQQPVIHTFETKAQCEFVLGKLRDDSKGSFTRLIKESYCLEVKK